MGEVRPSGKLHICAVCGKQDMWRATWVWYGSYNDVDDGVPIFKACSTECMSRREETIEMQRISADIEAAKSDEQRLEDELARRRAWRLKAEANLANPTPDREAGR